MAVRGRKPKPAEMKHLTGNPGKRKIPEAPAFADGSSLAPPKRWKARGYERQEWDRIVPELQRLGIAKAVHQGALEKICELYAVSVKLYEREDYTGARMAAAEYRKALNEFGLTAASAARVTIGARNDDEDPEAEFFTGPRPVA